MCFAPDRLRRGPFLLLCIQSSVLVANRYTMKEMSARQAVCALHMNVIIKKINGKQNESLVFHVQRPTSKSV